MKNTFALAILGLSTFGGIGCLSPILTRAEGQKPLPAANATEQKSPDAGILADCGVSFKSQGLCASMDWVKYPSDSEAGEFTLRFWQAGHGKANGPYFAPAFPLFVRLWMPSMGHGSAPVELSPFIDSNGLALPGVYKVSHVFFVMRGAWEIQVQLKDATNLTSVVDQASFSLLF